MAFRTWGRVLLAALGVAAFAGAAQLGIAYGLGVVRFGRVFDPSAEGLWAAQVAWVAWFAIVATVAGAVAGSFLASRQGLVLVNWAPRLAVTGMSAVGALAVAPLAMLPARATQLTSINPVLTAGLAAVLGALIGAAAALAALSHRPFGWNIGLVVGGVWLVTLLSVAPSLSPTDPLPDVRLGVIDSASLSDATANRLAVLTMPALALLAGMMCGLLSRSRTYPTVVAAGCGAIGPGLVAMAYLAAGPGGADSYQAAPYWGALIGAGAGALGSVLATVVLLPTSLPHGALGRRSSPDPQPGPDPHAASVPGPEPATAPVGAAEAEPVRDAPVPAPAPAERPVTAALPPSEPVEATPHRPDERTDGPDASVPERHPLSLPGTAEPTPAPAGRPGAPLGDGSWNAFAAAERSRDAADAAQQSQRAARGRGRSKRPVPARDEEYVDWVSGLSDPEEPANGESPQTRRTLRGSRRQQDD